MAMSSDVATLEGFTFVRELGAGATGRVVLGRDESTGELVALKFLDPALASRPAFAARFNAEADVLRRVRHPNVVGLRDVLERGGAPVLVLDLVEGVPLRALVDAEPTTPEAALYVLSGSLQGLHAAHAVGVVHRDYKPENVLVDATATSRLVDFGIAVPVATADGELAGTPAYMAPELWTGGRATPATDVYAATIVLVECLTGRCPLTASSMAAWEEAHREDPVPLDGVPEPLHELVATGTAKSTEVRYRDAATFLAALEAAAVAGYGPDWAARGRDSVAGAVAGLAALFPSAAGGMSAMGAAGSSGASTFLSTIPGKVLAVLGAGALAVGVTGALLWVNGDQAMFVTQPATQAPAGVPQVLGTEITAPPPAPAPSPAAPAPPPPSGLTGAIVTASTDSGTIVVPVVAPPPETPRDSGGGTPTPPPVPPPVVRHVATMSLSSPAGEVPAGTPLTLTAAVAPALGGPAPTGTVQFADGGHVLGTQPLGSGGVAQLVRTLAPGTHVITASYSGDAAYLADDAAPITVVVDKYVTALTSSASVDPSALAVTLSATLEDATGHAVAGVPVVFHTNGGSCTGVTNAAGVASCNLALPLPGAVSLLSYTATFGGNSAYQSSSSSGGLSLLSL